MYLWVVIRSTCVMMTRICQFFFFLKNIKRKNILKCTYALPSTICEIFVRNIRGNIHSSTPIKMLVILIKPYVSFLTT